MKQAFRIQFILLYHCDVPVPGTPGCMINWQCGGVFDSKDDIVKWLLVSNVKNIKGHKTVRTMLPTAFVASPSDLVPIDGDITDLAEDEPEDQVTEYYKEEKV